MFVAFVEYLRWVLMIVILLNYKSREFTIVVFNKHVNQFDWKLLHGKVPRILQVIKID